MYRRIAHELLMAEPVERMALIHLVACQEEPALASDLMPPLPTAWRCRWARWQASAPNRILGRHTSRVSAVALGEVDGEPVVVSAAGTIGAALGCAFRPVPWPAPGGPHEDWVTAVALGEVDGEPVVVSGSDDKTVRLWDARIRPAPWPAPGGPHRLGACGGAGRSGRRAGGGFRKRGQDGAALGCAFRPAPWRAPGGPHKTW